MWIDELRIQNFRSFSDVNISLGKTNILVGANASGKSNFLAALRFLRDISESGLENAISLQGGVDLLVNRQLGLTSNLRIGFSGNPRTSHFEIESDNAAARAYEISWEDVAYDLELSFTRGSRGFSIVEDHMRVGISIVEHDLKHGDDSDAIYRIGNRIGEVTQGQLSLRSEKGAVIESAEFDKEPPVEARFFASPWVTPEEEDEGNRSRSLLERVDRPIFSRFGFYDIDPRLSRKALPVSGKAELEEDASNLVIVLERIFSDPEARRTFLNLSRPMLPFLADLQLERDAERITLQMAETFTEKPFPATLVSDGTISVIALVALLYFEKFFITIEEPERGVHPWLIARIMELINQTNPFKQVVLTTHSPEVVKHAMLDDLLLFERDASGFSTIKRPRQSQQLGNFLENELGLDELFVQNLLGI